jgi:hypothetical protein
MKWVLATGAATAMAVVGFVWGVVVAAGLSADTEEEK